MTAKEQNRLAGIFLMAHGGLQTLFMLAICAFYGIFGASIFLGGGRRGGGGEEQFVGLFFIAMIAFIFVFSMIFIIPQLVGGWKMYKEKPNARVWGIIGSICACLSVPLGTAAGVFGLIFLFGDQGTRFYATDERNLNGERNLSYLPDSQFTPSASDFTAQPREYVKQPPPNSWQ